jgi:tRNA dimethylallyltransferase
LTLKMDKSKIPVLALVGPTAVGKSSLALYVADLLNTDIISADSAQVYRKLDLGTAKPSPEEQARIRHHLINMVDPDEPYSVADYKRDTEAVIRDLRQAGKLPFMVGGTGLYVKAVLESYAFGSKGADDSFRQAFEQLAEEQGLPALYAKLKEVDPKAASKIHPNDRRRIIRALEVFKLEGKPISEQAAKTVVSESPYEPVYFGLNANRELLYRKIETRVDSMMADGFLQEVEALYREGYDENDPGMQILGYRQLLSFLKGDNSIDKAVAEIKKQTRNLAKRQLTWFRREKGIEWLKIEEGHSLLTLAEIICKKVKDLAL